ncbi:hypothetical protein LINPERHAP1_LOCUS3260 [Linum perenne]
MMTLFLTSSFIHTPLQRLTIWGPNHFDVHGFISDWQTRNYRDEFF